MTGGIEVHEAIRNRHVPEFRFHRISEKHIWDPDLMPGCVMESYSGNIRKQILKVQSWIPPPLFEIKRRREGSGLLANAVYCNDVQADRHFRGTV